VVTQNLQFLPAVWDLLRVLALELSLLSADDRRCVDRPKSLDHGEDGAGLDAGGRLGPVWGLEDAALETEGLNLWVAVAGNLNMTDKSAHRANALFCYFITIGALQLK
jgi:hypothetical protein